MPSRGSWGSRYGFYMAAIGSSFGLGNLWRFPYVVGYNGGGAFVLLYIFFALLIGISILIAELMLGKYSRSSAVGSMEFVSNPSVYNSRSQSPSAFKNWIKLDLLWFGRLAIFASVLLTSYYAVISGWVLYFFGEYVFSTITSNRIQPEVVFKAVVDSGVKQSFLSFCHIALATYIVMLGLREGVEKWIGYIMSIFIVLVLFLVSQSLQLPGAVHAVRFLFYPDFSKFKATTLIHVIGHVFFTLSIGMGAMIAFGSYLRDEVRTTVEGVRVGILDTGISLIVGLLIFPLVFSGETTSESGPGLLFQTIPILFSRMNLGPGFGMAFFLCLYCAALGATIGLLEAGVSNLIDRKRMSRKKAAVLMGGIVFGLSLFPSFSSTLFRSLSYGDKNLLQIFDEIIISWVLPLSGLGITLAVGYWLPDKVRRNEFMLKDELYKVRLYNNWIFLLKWVIPIILLGAILLNIIGIFLKFLAN